MLRKPILEYAKKMSKQEVESFNLFLKNKQDDKIKLAQETVEKYADVLIMAYHDKAKKISEKIKEHYIFIQKATYAYENKYCECGLKLKLFKNRFTHEQFLGCPNYQDETTTHRAWNYKPTKDYKSICSNWLGDIISSLDLKGKLHTKYLLMLYQANGLEDIQYKYTGLSSEILINRLTNLKKTSSEFELRQVEFLRNQWPTVLYQFPVKYKYQDDREKFCFIDILCSNEDTVCIYECKTSMSDINHVQMALYTDVIKCINESTGANKKITIDYLIEN